MKKTITLFLLWLSFSLVLAQSNVNHLNIVRASSGLFDPGTPAYFQSIKMQVEPRGAFANIAVQLELSGKYSQIENIKSELELIYKFKLPKGCIMHEAWLWMEGIPVKAKLYERAVAKVIYESYIERRTDPLIIYKDGDNYEARIYPVLNPEARKIEFSFLVPAQSTSKGISIPFSIEIFHQALSSPTKAPIDVKIDVSTTWGKPLLAPDLKDSVVENLLCLRISNEENTHAELNRLYFPNAIVQNSFEVYYDEEKKEQFYQMVIQEPSITQQKGKNYLFVMDYISDGVTVMDLELDKLLRFPILNNLNENDGFNVMFTSNGQIRLLSDSWIKAKPALIDSYLINAPMVVPDNEKIGTVDIMKSAVEYLNNHDSYGNLWIFTANEKLLAQSISATNTAVKSITELMYTPYPIMVIDQFDKLKFNFGQNGVNYYNNQLFWSNLTNRANCKYLRRTVNIAESRWWTPEQYDVLPLSELISSAFQTLKPVKELIGFNYFMDKAILYNQVDVGGGSLTPVENGFCNLGQFWGELPDTITVAYYSKVDSNFSVRNIKIPTNKIGKTGLMQYWAGNYIGARMTNNMSAAERDYAIEQSLKYQVLTDVTAFLAIEPDTIFEPISFDGNEPTIWAVDLASESNVNVLVFPNPVKNSFSITVESNNLITPGSLFKIWVRDITGKEIYQESGNWTALDPFNIQLNTDDLRMVDGVYFVTLQFGEVNKTVRIVKAN